MVYIFIFTECGFHFYWFEPVLIDDIFMGLVLDSLIVSFIDWGGVHTVAVVMILLLLLLDIMLLGNIILELELVG